MKQLKKPSLKKIFSILFLITSFVSHSQTVDFTISTMVISPDSNGCDLGQENLTVILVKTTSFPYSGTAEMGYTINSGSPVVYPVAISGLNGPALVYTFANTIDLSNCQVHDLAVWVNDPSDIDNSNDTIHFQITSDCSSSEATIEPSDNCYTYGDTLYLNNYNGNIITWAESNDNGITWNSTSTPNDWYLPTNGTPSKFRVTIDSPYGICGTDTIFFNAPFDNYLMSVDAGNDTTIFINDSLQLNGTGGTFYTWYPEFNMTDSTLSNPLIWPNITTLYFMESSDGGCTGLDSVLITVIDNSQISVQPANDLLVPSLILPQNDNWHINGIEKHPQNRLTIFNMNGKLVYSANPYMNQLPSDYLSAGTYVYMLDLNSINQLLRGKVTVMH